MTRDSILDYVLKIPNKSILLELATGVGKTKLAIELIKHRKGKNILVVIPRNVLIENWKTEFNKWYKNNKLNITYTTYVSFPKHKGKYDICVFDEVHHLSERCRDALGDFTYNSAILLSATVSKDFKDIFYKCFDNLKCYKVSAEQAIDYSILPDPKIYLLPLYLDNTTATINLVVNPKGAGNGLLIPYSKIWEAKRNRKTKYIVRCTPRQYYNEISSLIDWYKKRAMSNMFMKNRWLHECSKRLKFLSSIKTEVLLELLEHLKRHRTLTFCGSIEQTEEINPNGCINSENKNSSKALTQFNEGTINHITAVDCLNEGVNLVNCQVGIFGVINSSELLQVQKIGRILRHKKPVIIIPYYISTREEEIKNKMLEKYNPELITIVSSINEIEI